MPRPAESSTNSTTRQPTGSVDIYPTLVELTATVEYELYDYQTDPHETRNLAADHPDTVQQLQKLLATTKSPLVSGDMDLFGSAGR
jgi:arylsulfatase A-like enzyme